MCEMYRRLIDADADWMENEQVLGSVTDNWVSSDHWTQVDNKPHEQ